MLADNMMRFGNEATQNAYDERFFGYGHPTMWGFGNWTGGAFWIFGVLWLATWVLFIIALIALIRWLWKKGDKVK